MVAIALLVIMTHHSILQSPLCT